MKFIAIMLWLALLSLVGLDQFERWEKRPVVSSIGSVTKSREALLYVDYNDENYGFSMVVPKDWSRIISEDTRYDLDLEEAGYSVIFESELENDADPYMDYIMVEVLPGIETGAFDTDGAQRGVVIVDGQKAVKDEMVLVDFPFKDTTVDLAIKQAEIAQLGYTVGLYAIGTKDNAQMLDEAFQALLYSFQLPEQPYLVTLHQ